MQRNTPQTDMNENVPKVVTFEEDVDFKFTPNTLVEESVYGQEIDLTVRQLSDHEIETEREKVSIDYARLVIETSSDEDSSDAGRAPATPPPQVQEALLASCDKVVFLSSDLLELKKILMSNPTCLVCTKATDIIENSLMKTADVPFRDDFWYKIHQQEITACNEASPAFRLPDWSYSSIMGAPSHNFLRNLRRSVTASDIILNICESNTMGEMVTNADRKHARHSVAGNPYIIYACHMRDKDILPLEGNLSFFHKLYLIRRRVGFNTDFGYMADVKYVPQAYDDDDDTTDSFSEHAPLFRERVSKLFSAAGGLVKNWAECIVKIFFKTVGSMLGMISSAFHKLGEMFQSMCVSLVKRMFNIEKLMKTMHTKGFKDKVMATICVMFMLTFFSIMGFSWYLSNRINKAVVNAIVNYNFEEKQDMFKRPLPSWHPIYHAQSKADPVAAAVMLGCYIWNIDGKKTQTIKAKANMVMDMMKLGTIVSCTTSCVYALMPVVLKECIASFLETPENQLKREALEWCGLTNELGKMQQIPSVMACKMYKEKIDDQQKEGQRLLEKLKGPSYSDVRTFTMSCLVRLYQISAILTAMSCETKKRDEPFSVHICGKGGVGKSLLVETLLQRALDVNPEDIYSKNCGEEFYSGYHGQPAVIMDEFCVGSAQTRETISRQYLTLISSAQSRLEMASLNDIRVGIKGTCFTSDYVFTINNIRYDKVDGIDNYAFWRRRECVVEFERSSDFRVDREGNLDFTQYSAQEIRDAVMVTCSVFPRQPHASGVDRPLVNQMSFPALCMWLKARYEIFKSKQAVVKEALGSVYDEKVNPEQMIENIYRKASGIPLAGSSMMDTVKSFFFSDEDDDEYTSQNPTVLVTDSEGSPSQKKRHNHVCKICGEKRRHEIDVPYDCERCGSSNSTCGPRDLQNSNVAFEYRANKDEVYDFKTAQEALGIARVKCARFACQHQKVLTSAMKQYLDEPWLCADHKFRFGNHENVVEINRSIAGLPGLVVVHEDKDSWERAVMEELKDYPVRLWHEVIVPQCRAEFDAGKNLMKNVNLPFQILSLGLVIAAAIRLRNFRVKEEKSMECLMVGHDQGPQAECRQCIMDSELTFESQALYDRSTRTHKKRGSLFDSKPQKGAGFSAQSLPPLKALRLRIKDIEIYAVPIGGHDLLTFHHSVIDQDGEVALGPYDMELDVGQQTYKAIFTSDCVRSFPDRDFMIIRFDDKRLPQFKDITRRFLTRDQVDDFAGKVLIKVESPRSEMYSQSEVIQACYQATKHRYEMPKMLRYNCYTLNGDCGSPVILATGNDVGKIVGIHVAGTGEAANPRGLATFVAKEDLEELRLLYEEERPKDLCETFIGQNMDTVANYHQMMAAGELPNLAKVENIPVNRRMHCHDKSKLKPSAIAKHLGWEPQKAPAILSQDDPRANGLDPMDVAVKKLGAVPAKNKFNDEEIARVKADMIKKYTAIVDESPHAVKPLTLEQAVAGVPGLIKSMDTSTAAGYPLGLTVKRGGKKSLISHIDGVCVISDDFVRMCEELEEEMMNYDGDVSTIDFSFQAFAKDELRSQKKLDKIDTRLTYANDMRFNAIIRKYLMPIVLAITTSFGKNGMAISLNPQSFDMDKIYCYLREVSPTELLRVIDGDFSGFDINHEECVIYVIFQILFALMKRFVSSEKFFSYVFDHETRCGATIKDILYQFIHILCSGSQFTTIFNCLVNEFYFRILFGRNFPHLIYDNEIRNVVLGDDHLVSKSDKIDWTPVKVGKGFEELGLVYTSARKNEALKDECTPFGECLFLGSVPQRHHGHWSGALRKETLQESLLWTRNNNKTMDAEVVQMIEAASQWDKPYFLSYVEAIKGAYARIDRPFPKIPGSYEGLGFSVASRTTDSGADYPIYRAQSNGSLDAPKQSVHEDGLTTLLTDTTVSSSNVPQVDIRSLAGRSLNERSADITFGAGSSMKRLTVAWSYSQTEGTSLISSTCPFGLLGLADQNNLQNMAFQNFLYSVTGATITFQVNGTPTQAGLLIAYWVPLLSHVPDRSSKPSFQHVWLTPHESTTAELKIPFHYWRSALNSTNAAYYPEVLGRIHVDVFSPLVSLANTTCDLTMFVSFDADFKIPRPIPVAPTDGTLPNFGFSKNSTGTLNVAAGTYSAQGSNVSTTNVNQTYTVGDVAGDMPIQVGVDGGGTQSGQADLSVPMDNPPVSGGAIPVSGQFSSMSKSNGSEITTSLQLHQQQMSYQPIHSRSPLDTNIQELCGKRGYLTKFNWSATNLLSTSLLDLRLDSAFNFLAGTTPNLYNSVQLPMNVAVLNQFMFWKGDIVFEICAVKTPFHSGRIMASVAYGDDTVNVSELNVYMNNVLDFNGEASWQSFRVNYNNSQEFMRTYNGNGNARSRDYSVGALTLSVLNELRSTSEVVSSTIEVLVFVRFENVKVAVPRPNPIVHFQTTETVYIAQSSGVLNGSPDATDSGEPIVVDTTATTINTPSVKPCKLEFGEKFDYCVSDVHELVRRHIPIPFVGAPTSKTANAASAIGITRFTIHNNYQNSDQDVYRIPVRLNSIWNYVYAGWSGHIKYRIFCYDSRPALVWYVPHDESASFVDTTDPASAIIGVADGRIATGVGTDVFETSLYPTNIPREMSYPYTTGCSMIDVSVPFCTQYNFLPNYERAAEVPDATANWGNGYLYIKVSTNAAIDVFHAAGDDFRFHVYCPDNGVRGKILSKIGTTTTTFTAGDRIGGYYAS